MKPARSISVLFAAAAGPRQGFGHLIRCGVLADAVGCRRDLVLHGGPHATHVALALGWTVHRNRIGRLLAALGPDLLVVDDPSSVRVQRWVREARRFGVPVATIHDAGIARVASDLTIDGSVAPFRSAHLRGPKFAVINPALRAIRHARPSQPPSVVVALGAGETSRRLALRVAARVAAVAPHARIHMASGFMSSDRSAQPAPPRCDWLPPASLPTALASASIVIAAGGLTLYEACALGRPVVALPIVAAQKKAVRRFARAGAAISADAPTRDRAIERAAVSARWLLDHPAAAAALGRAGRSLVDGRGAERVAAHLERSAAGAREVRRVA